MQFSTKIDGFEQKDSQGFENSYNSYEQYPLEKFFIFTSYQNYTWVLICFKEKKNLPAIHHAEQCNAWSHPDVTDEVGWESPDVPDNQLPMIHSNLVHQNRQVLHEERRVENRHEQRVLEDFLEVQGSCLERVGVGEGAHLGQESGVAHH